MRIIRHTLSLVLLTMVMAGHSQAQERLNDFELWAKLAVEGDVSERLKLGLEQQIRFDQNSSELKNYFTEIALNYNLSENFTLLGRARFLTRNDNSGADQGRKNYFRYQLGTRLKHRAGQWRFNHRLLYQRRDRMNLKPAEGDVLVKYIRYRFKTEYKIKSWPYDPLFTVEYFHALKNEFEEHPKAMRVGIGTERNYKKVGTFGLWYRYEWTLDYAFPQANYILSLAYTYKF